MARPFLIVPLYMYPLETAWDPLFRAARAHPEVKFVAIVNPSSGPGPDSLPDASYLAALETMHAIPNICAVGYVYCSYGKRPAADVRGDIVKYCWWNQHDKISLGGIFFDETPSELAYLTHMASLAHHAKRTWRQETGRDGLVVYNPGVLVPRPFFVHPDHVVVFEQSHHHWDENFAAQRLRHAADEVRSKTAAVIHSSQVQGAQVGDLTRSMLTHGLTGIYVTDEKDGGYTQWPSVWTELAAAVAAECSAS
ncbi:hypothetical protein J3458_012977 [Metarhizium acridum]|uniref:Spherulation-specific family 4 n=1 Tax=Metarhizium acridum (strain CQMa 102) TaxID=655827 RepID=E9DWZ3_METAQ|nr:uncharacterized protein MAC_02141 [Metarhizium acridum CQMa 102]EFY91856.1 hypothetical protein MAC_02141 [Metarhizium acridum CQMa 102]KAG8413414.1 hypothetical protein J3458_012977 [Metarhizium acridum]